MKAKKACKCGECDGRDHFPGYPGLRRVANTDRGEAELIEVTPTSDGYLLGLARFGEGENSYVHSVFLGGDPRKQGVE